nr:hypothetical protein GCM10020093_084400 [Planobispora longispora]
MTSSFSRGCTKHHDDHESAALPGAGHRPGPLGKKDQAGKLTETKGRYLAAVAEAEAWLVQQGFDPWEIAEMDLPRQVRRCWWHDDHGFVPDGWEGQAPGRC